MDLERVMSTFITIMYGANFSTLAQIERLLFALLYGLIGKSCPLFGRGVRDFFWFLAVVEVGLVLLAEMINVAGYLGWMP